MLNDYTKYITKVCFAPEIGFKGGMVIYYSLPNGYTICLINDLWAVNQFCFIPLVYDEKGGLVNYTKDFFSGDRASRSFGYLKNDYDVKWVEDNLVRVFEGVLSYSKDFLPKNYFTLLDYRDFML